MARPLQLLSLLCRLGARSVLPSVPVNSFRFASRGASKAWAGRSHEPRGRVSDRDDMSDDELDDVEDKVQALVDEERKKQRTVKYHILRRHMTPSGAPQRKLTWDAMEQIRYLKQEQPDEWTVERLAEGFSVTPDVIRRVLRSKFHPPPEKKAKQDSKVMAGLRQQVLPSGAGSGLKLPGQHTPAALPPGGGEGAVVPVAERTLMLRGEGSAAPLAKSPAPLSVLPSQVRAGVGKVSPDTECTEEDSSTNTNPTEENREDEESWDGRVMTEEELEEFMEMEKPSPVVQVGKDFFDAEGNFLYRI
ncbi:neugrin [Acanthopagrus latus]|uniref:neugrin n=1 Tax=Acanthopagrus latus TaxID=8177 RepID=UPI00187C5EC1|nr:neugrin [Acanthopagrus latus]